MDKDGDDYTTAMSLREVKVDDVSGRLCEHKFSPTCDWEQHARESVLLLLGWEQECSHIRVWEHPGEFWLVNQLYQPTRRLCVLANTKLYHRHLLLWISMKFWILVITTLGLFSKDPPKLFTPIHIQSWPKSKSSLGQFKHCSESLI